MSARLFLKKIKIFNFLILSMLVQFSFGQDLRFLNDIDVKQEKLVYLRDSVRFTVKGKIPIESVMTPRNPQMKLVWKSETDSINFGMLSLKKNLSDYAVEKDFKIPFKPWMESAVLEARFFQGKKASNQPYEIKILRKGVDTTPFLAKIGRVVPDEQIPTVGLAIPVGVTGREAVRNREFQFFFNPGESNYLKNSSNESVFEDMTSFLTENPAIVSVKITGLQSPEQREGRSSRLGMDRATSIKSEIVKRNLLLRDSIIQVSSRWNDWFDLRLLLRDFPELSTSKKDSYYAILMNGEDFLTQQEQLRSINGFDQLSRQLFPKLRVAKVEIIAKPGSGLGTEKTAILRQELEENIATSKLSFLDWAIAGETAPRLEEKARIYSKMTTLFRSPLPYNNLGLVRMREAQRTLDRDVQENLWNEAEWLLQQAIKLENNPYSLHNLGQIYALKGNYWEAYKYLSGASVLTRDPEFLMINESLRGALDILRGDYKLATLRYDYAFTDPADFFNKGLAYFLAGNYGEASLAFEESVIRSRDFGYGYYGLALVAINSGQKEVAMIQLEKAVAANESLYLKALIDPNFDELRGIPEFFQILRRSK
ncbi:MAG TPA: hypothetical protein DEQ87_16760 [Algoriphagus sp.]|nr:hypothetical protein [Algoriphagus sp.]MAN88411.1 hypothetical protein [Algoriphagus sp.]HAH38404.1 hypothetical protein [Algoriphagus sp.]HAS57802.1 hypothetical protein [Algoriphagus sp.]HAZ24521.1 hypothetical protein [Algoriphagus sp.]|tara:strand:+ start:707 stop:2494 length:1788 start_codon:yes stop_codon:yes gene_type:complete